MALSRVYWRRVSLGGAGAPPGHLLSLRLQPGRRSPAWGPPRSSRLHLSPKGDVKSLVSSFVAKTKVVNEKYNRFLERRFPRFYAVYSLFFKVSTRCRQVFFPGHHFHPTLCQLPGLPVDVQKGAHPSVGDLLPLKKCFSVYPLDMSHLSTPHVKALSRAMLLTPHLPSVLLRYRLNKHTTVLHQLDKALKRLGIGQLTAQEVKSACYLRGLDSTHLPEDWCRIWLAEWLQFSSSLTDADVSFLLHAVVLFSTNFPGTRH
ncbi:LETM1 domain-containing protein 1 isoform X2 [Dromiciops gliroides]|uniref:LETM1 domain-containing protein 1 isoform X2 n=1 Tax=Dromiciops gliroides TaxID=33562 RepID=UPI001CC36019|nr:LETM1 domain-containing protein 1 isoform X2 [Dromiciops gliroides]